MLNKIFIIVIIAFCKQVYYCQNNFSIKLTEEKIIAKSKEGFSYVNESPDGTWLCYSNKNIDKVFIKNLRNKKQRDKLICNAIGCGYIPSWSVKSDKIFMKSKTIRIDKKTELKTNAYNLKKSKTTEVNNVNPRSLYGSIIHDDSTYFDVYINEKLQLVKSTSNSIEVISSEKSYQPIVSPDRKSMAVHHGSHVWVYAINDEKQPIDLGEGLVTSWSPDSNYLLGFSDTSADGHTITNSELYVFNVITKEKIQITNTPNKHEINPSWSSDGKSIYYVDAKLGAIYNATLKVN